jgi:hypothetical protein
MGGVIGHLGNIVDPVADKLLQGFSHTDPAKPAVYGSHKADGNGVRGESATGEGVIGWTIANDASAAAVRGQSEGTGPGVHGESRLGSGVLAISHAGSMAAVEATNDAVGGIGISAKGGSLAGLFVGDVEVRGDIRLVNAGDCAENFDVEDSTEEPGTVMVASSNGRLRASNRPYDKRVAGVISGAGDLRPGVVLGSRGLMTDRLPIALIGRAYCKVDASYAPVEVGDLLTTSETRGHAMKATDPLLAFGSVIGKALQPVYSGVGLIPVLVALQ